ncbi:hypothetical protein [Tritonibacter mobilis]|nr:hypothetical protein [Tritonibacter mobilis]
MFEITKSEIIGGTAAAGATLSGGQHIPGDPAGFDTQAAFGAAVKS